MSEDVAPNFPEHQAKDFIELHEQVESSLNLLGSLESFLGTFQKDLSAVSGHISDLQARSKDFDNRLKGRRKVATPLTTLLSTVTIPPQLATTLLDTPVSETWVPAIHQLEALLLSISAYSKGKRKSENADLLGPQNKVKAAKDLEGVAEGLRIVATTKIRTHFLALLQPIRTSLTTNLHVLQTSLFLKKFLPLYRFLQRNSSTTADEIKDAYIQCVKLYYETGMRRYTRSLGWIRAKASETPVLIGSTAASAGPQDQPDAKIDDVRLSSGKLDGPGVILAYLGDDKTFTSPLEAIFRSAILVLLDNASAEYSFIRKFFKQEPFRSSPSKRGISSYRSQMGSDDFSGTIGRGPASEADMLQSPLSPRRPPSDVFTESRAQNAPKKSIGEDKAEQKAFESIWKQIFDPVLPYVETLVTSIITPTPPLIPLLTMIRLSDAVLKEATTQRQCTPLEPFLIGLRFQLWPLFQKQMSENVDSVKVLADGAGSGSSSTGGAFGASFFGGGKTNVKNDVVQRVATRYAVLFSSVIALSEEEEEVMLFSNLQRLRQELNRLITGQASKIKDPAQSAALVSTLCESLLHMISSGERLNTHPKAQAEVAFWREREEEARRRIASTRR